MQMVCVRREAALSLAQTGAAEGSLFPLELRLAKAGTPRTRAEHNWRITKPTIKGTFYTRDPQAMIRAIFEGMTSPAWHARFDRQLKDDVGGLGNRQSMAIFGEPGAGKSEFVLTSRHLTLRCDGDSAEHVAFGGPILYAMKARHSMSNPITQPMSSGSRRSKRTSCFTSSTPEIRRRRSSSKARPARNWAASRAQAARFNAVPSPSLHPTRRPSCSGFSTSCSHRSASPTRTKPSRSRRPGWSRPMPPRLLPGRRPWQRWRL